MIYLKQKQLNNQPQQQQNTDITTTTAWKRAALDQKEFNEFPQQLKIRFPDPKDILYFEVEVRPDEGFWAGGMISFTVHVTEEYPMRPPKVLCKKRVFHPNIDLEGKVCLNILRDEWKPVEQLKTVVYGLFYLFNSPNATDPLNKDAAEMMLKNQKEFAQIVKSTMKGGSFGNVAFDKLYI